MINKTDSLFKSLKAFEPGNGDLEWLKKNIAYIWCHEDLKNTMSFSWMSVIRFCRVPFDKSLRK